MSLAQLRRERGLSQSEMAKLLGISRERYANYERGLRQPRLEMARRLAQAFGISLDELTQILTGPAAAKVVQDSVKQK